MPRRTSRGRQRIPMRRIENQDDLYATFSKRRRGLFKKAGELSTLCGASTGVLVFSPTNNPFSFWHPSIQPVIQRCRNPNLPIDDLTRSIEDNTEGRLRNYNTRLDEVLDEKDIIVQQEKQMDENDQTREKVWWEQTPVESLNQDQLKEWRAWFEDFLSKAHTIMSEKVEKSNSIVVQQQNDSSIVVQQQNTSNFPTTPDPRTSYQGFSLGPSHAPTGQMVRLSQPPNPQIQPPFIGGGIGHVPSQFYNHHLAHFPQPIGGINFLRFHGMLNYFPLQTQTQTTTVTAQDPNVFNHGFPLSPSYTPPGQTVRPYQPPTEYNNVPTQNLGDGTSHVPSQYYNPQLAYYPQPIGGIDFLQFRGMFNYFPSQGQTQSTTESGAASSGGQTNYFPWSSPNLTFSGPRTGEASTISATNPSVVFSEAGEPSTSRVHNETSTHGEVGEPSTSRGD
ncbi:Agamous-like MADS-box protein AGL62 [Striga hermonthica]|uniref:Agamous-like MADS-box protein AGL62 n=1 Tax=Striga hermonthica TaxID=68872 RepID=A0A9N7NW51_STRHE|nr:Agamous-like MADS-box protein AGL62 [Striga hermonthica]